MYYFDFGDINNLDKESIKRTFTTENNITLTFELYYNNTDGFIYMNLYDGNGEQLVMGVKLVQEVNLFEKFAHIFETSIVAAILPSNADYEYLDVTIDNFDNGVRMYYYEDI